MNISFNIILIIAREYYGPKFLHCLILKVLICHTSAITDNNTIDANEDSYAVITIVKYLRIEPNEQI